ncbi:MAG: sigma-70 family RNA polymerase sigma factor [Carboxydocellales bacterium]|jgi:RNA polymerase sigma-70 factor (ECF subfamily)
MVLLSLAEESSLVTRAKHDDLAFNEFYSYYFPRVYNYVHYRVADTHVADDLTSQIFEKLLTRLECYSPEKANFPTWLFTVARNTVTDYYRSRSRSIFSSLDTITELTAPEQDPGDIIALNEIQQHLMRALASINKRERDLIALKFWSGLSNRDIARLTGISDSSVGVILFRAMRRLRRILESQGLNSYD